MAGRNFPDHFSGGAAQYAAARPRYPDSLFAALAQWAPDTEVVWDCGAGSGQASVALASHFTRVIATDASAAQIAQAEPHARVEYRTALAEASGLAASSISLVTVAQALHWFDVDAFHAEVKRVLKPQGVIAEWTYALMDVPTHPAIARVVNALDSDMQSWWPPQRRHVDAHYTTLPFPFAPIEVGSFAMSVEWTLPQLLNYLATWSAVTRARAQSGVDPLESVAAALRESWGDETAVTITWPLTVRAGRVVETSA